MCGSVFHATLSHSFHLCVLIKFLDHLAFITQHIDCAPPLNTKQDSTCKISFHFITVSSMEGAFLIIWVLLIHLLSICMFHTWYPGLPPLTSVSQKKGEHRVTFGNYIKKQIHSLVSSIRKIQKYINSEKD